MTLQLMLSQVKVMAESLKYLKLLASVSVNQTMSTTKVCIAH